MNSIHAGALVSRRHQEEIVLPSGIDHVVITVNDLDEATRSFEAHGFTVTFGGHHEHRPSSNVLIPFADSSYIELIGFRPHDGPIVDPWWDLHQRGEGLVDFAVRTESVADDLARLERAGVSARGPVSGGRNRPDGVRVDWQVARIAPQEFARAPFIIEDLTPIERRIPSGDATTHANGSTRIAGATVLVTDLERAATLYEGVIGSPGTRDASELDPSAQAIRFQVGNQWIDLVQPVAPELREVLDDRGPGIASFSLSPGEGQTSKSVVVHGARIRVS